MKPSVNFGDVARLRVTDEAALAEVLTARHIAGAGIDVTTEEPPTANSPLCGIEHVATTPHPAGETCRYEDNMIEILRATIWRPLPGRKAMTQPGCLKPIWVRVELSPCPIAPIAQGDAASAGIGAPSATFREAGLRC